eukprot:scaffold21595_cov41-Tisochrysis_lutea.AAC.2
MYERAQTSRPRRRAIMPLSLALLLSLATASASVSSTPTVPACAARTEGQDVLRPALLRLRGGVQQLESVEEWEEIRENEARLVVLDFTATWCGPCQRIAPVYAELADEYSETALLLKIDVDELPELTAELGVSSMPTFLFFKDGEKVGMVRGADEASLREKLEELTA